MAAPAWGILFTLVFVAFAGCSGDPNETAPDRDVRQSWEQERAAHGAMGVPAFLDLHGAPFHLFGNEGHAGPVEAPIDFVPVAHPGAEHPFVFFGDARVEGFGEGLVTFEGDRIRAAGGSLAEIAVRGASSSDGRLTLHPAATPALAHAGVLFPQAWAEAQTGYFLAEPTPLTLQGATLSGYSRALLLQADGSVELPNEVVLDASSVYMGSGSILETAATAPVSFTKFALAGNFSSGNVMPVGGLPYAAVTGVFGNDLDATVAPAGLVADQFRLTQVLDREGPKVPASVELLPFASTFAVDEHGSEWFSVSLREASYKGDAVLKNILVTGTGAPLIEIPVQGPPTYLGELLSLLDEVAHEAPWAAPFVALPVAFTAPFLVMVDFAFAAACAFSTCPQDFPYPTWIDAGAVGVFYFKVNGALDPGEYEAVLTFEGLNYGPTSFPLTITVE